MKYSLFIVFFLIGVSHGFFGNIGQTINNIGNTIDGATNEVGGIVDGAITDVKEQVENFVSQLSSIANGLQFAANFLWDSLFSPAFDMTIQGKIHY
jgi:phage-related protein